MPSGVGGPVGAAGTGPGWRAWGGSPSEWPGAQRPNVAAARGVVEKNPGKRSQGEVDRKGHHEVRTWWERIKKSRNQLAVKCGTGGEGGASARTLAGTLALANTLTQIFKSHEKTSCMVISWVWGGYNL